MYRRKREKLYKYKKRGKTVGFSGTTTKDANYIVNFSTKPVGNREKGPCSKRFPLYFTERTRFVPLLNIKPVTLIDVRLNLTGSRGWTKRHYYFNLK